VQIGEYQAVARLKDARGTSDSAAVRFECTASDSPGFLRVSKKDPRFLEFSEGRPFFAIGQNLAFIGYGQYVTPAKAEEIFSRLAENGANFVRVWTCCEDWALAIEARKSVWGRSWSWKPPFVPALDDDGKPTGRQCVELAGDDGKSIRLEPNYRVNVRPATRYVLSARVRSDGQARLQIDLGRPSADGEFLSQASPRWSDFRQEFTTGPDERSLGQLSLRLQGAGKVLVDELSLREAAGGAELLWEAAVNRPVRGFYNPIDSDMLDRLVEAAEREGIYMQLCVVTRDLYMKSLGDAGSAEYQQAIDDAKKFLRYCVARWGYSTHVAAWEYFNEIDPGLPTDRFYQELGEYLEAIDPYHHIRTTSTWNPSPKDWRHPKLDLAEMHHYLRPVSGDQWKDEVAVTFEKARFLQQNTATGPMLIGEYGLADDKWGLSPYVKQDQELVHFHNALWASSLSGLSGTAMFWWWESLDAQDGYRHYRPLSKFLADVPFTTAGLRPISATLAEGGVRIVEGNVRMAGMKGNDRAYLWLFNPQATWWNLVVEKATPSEIRAATVEIEGLPAGRYRVEWWDTYQGTVLRSETVAVSQAVLRLTAPAFSRDIACKIVPQD
jgi:hypothetical protein